MDTQKILGFAGGWGLGRFPWTPKMSRHDDAQGPSPAVSPLRLAIEQNLARLGDDPAYRWLGSRLDVEFSLSGRDLRTLGAALAADLCARPSPPRRIAIVTPGGPEFLVALLGCIFAGFECVAPPFPSPGPTRGRFEKIIAQCRPDCILAAESDMARLRETLASSGFDQAALVPIAMQAPGFDADAALDRLPLRDCRILQHTSGTSGSPRAVALTGANVAANTALTIKSWNISSKDSTLTWLPHHHDMGLFGCIITPLVVGGTINQMAPFTFLKRPSLWMDAVSRTGATLTGGPAFAMRLAIDTSPCPSPSPWPSPGELDLTRLRGLFCGSEPIAPDLLTRFVARFAPAGLSPEAVFACYGLAESTLYVAGRPGAGLTPACRMVEDEAHEVRIVDPATCVEARAGEDGEIWVAGPSVASAYLDAPEESAATFGGKLENDPQPARNWLRTGDIGRIKGPDLIVSGRIRDMVIANGANVPAAEIEWSAAASDSVFEGMAAICFAYGPIEEGATALVVEIDKRAAGNLDAERAKRRIVRAVRSAHGVELADVRIVRRGTLPRTTSGKVQRGEVRTMFLEDKLVEAAPAAGEITP
jgi:acyl-CoA synthetase (AMP-forming)/AMP-acid ligase II